MKRWRIVPAGPRAVDACGLHIPPGGLERELDEATVGLLSGDARVTVTPVEEPDAGAAQAPKKARGKRS